MVVSSNAHRHGRLELDDLDWQRREYRPYGAYADSKLANLLFMSELQRRLTAAGSTLRAMAAHPGYTATNITAHTERPAFDRVSRLGNRLLGMSADEGVRSLLVAATGDLAGNSYVGPGQWAEMRGRPTLVGRSERASDPRLARALWERTNQLTGISWP